jgi:acetyltransferase-like isoleucine patch superfamily enzyme
MDERRFKKAIATHWKVLNEFKRWLTYPYVRFLFAINEIQWNHGWRLYGSPIIQKHRSSSIRFGVGLQLRSWLRSNPLGPNHPVIIATTREGACLHIGDNFGMTGGTLCASEQVIIGNNVVLGANTTVTDTDFHPLDSEGRKARPAQGQTAAVTIKDEVFIGMNCLILKGVCIGLGSVVGAGSVITKDVPAAVVVAGNPARVIRKLQSPKVGLKVSYGSNKV